MTVAQHVADPGYREARHRPSGMALGRRDKTRHDGRYQWKAGGSLNGFGNRVVQLGLEASGSTYYLARRGGEFSIPSGEGSRRLSAIQYLIHRPGEPPLCSIKLNMSARVQILRHKKLLPSIPP